MDAEDMHQQLIALLDTDGESDQGALVVKDLSTAIYAINKHSQLFCEAPADLT